jgi:hypothetical protein
MGKKLVILPINYIVLLVIAVTIAVPALGWTEVPDLQVTPDLIEIGAFFQGHQVKVSGKIPGGADAVLEIQGPAAPEELMRKGRRMGLWMNVGELHISGAPSLYQVLSSKAELLSVSNSSAPWGYPALKRRITFSGQVQENEVDNFTNQFLELKEEGKLYVAKPGGLKVSLAAEGYQTVTGSFQLPPNVKPDTYKVCLLTINNGQVGEQKCSEFQVKMVGFPEMLSTLAHKHGLVYGILAVVIALATGFIMGVLFKGGGGH